MSATKSFRLSQQIYVGNFNAKIKIKLAMDESKERKLKYFFTVDLQTMRSSEVK